MIAMNGEPGEYKYLTALERYMPSLLHYATQDEDHHDELDFLPPTELFDKEDDAIISGIIHYETGMEIPTQSDSRKRWPRLMFDEHASDFVRVSLQNAIEKVQHKRSEDIQIGFTLFKMIQNDITKKWEQYEDSVISTFTPSAQKRKATFEMPSDPIELSSDSRSHIRSRKS